MELLVIVVVMVAYYFGKEVGRQEGPHEGDEVEHELQSNQTLPR